MSKRQSIIVVFGLIVLPWIIFAVTSPESGTTSATSEPERLSASSDLGPVEGHIANNAETDKDSAIKALSREVARLGAEVSALKKTVSNIQPQTQLASIDSEQSIGTEPRFNILALKEAIEAADEKDRQIIADESKQMATRFDEEPVDSAWAAETSNQITALMASDQFSQVSITDLQCRSNQCRLEIEADNTEDGDQFMDDLPRHMMAILPTMSAYQIEDENGLWRTAVYAGRKGFNR